MDCFLIIVLIVVVVGAYMVGYLEALFRLRNDGINVQYDVGKKKYYIQE